MMGNGRFVFCLVSNATQSDERKLARLKGMDHKLGAEKMDSSNSDKKEYDKKCLTLIHALAFDIRNPLTSMKGYSDLLLSEELDLDNETKKQFIQKISLGIKTANNVLEAYKKLAKIESGLLRTEIEPVDLSTVIHDAVGRQQSNLELKSVNLQLNLPNNFPMVNARSYEVYELFDGLLQDAITYAAPNAQIAIVAFANKKTIKTTITTTDTKFLEDHYKRYYDDFMNLSAIEHYIEQFGGEFGEETKKAKAAPFGLPCQLQMSRQTSEFPLNHHKLKPRTHLCHHTCTYLNALMAVITQVAP